MYRSDGRHIPSSVSGMTFRVALLNVLNIAEVLVDSRLHEVENSFRLSEDIMSTSQPTGTPAKLSESTQQRLNSYALAAAAAGAAIRAIVPV